eukprot:6533434-Prymnesium_polylepis.1
MVAVRGVCAVDSRQRRGARAVHCPRRLHQGGSARRGAHCGAPKRDGSVRQCSLQEVDPIAARYAGPSEAGAVGVRADLPEDAVFSVSMGW